MRLSRKALLVGNLMDGMSVVGWFDGEEAACVYGEKLQGDWLVVDLHALLGTTAALLWSPSFVAPTAFMDVDVDPEDGVVIAFGRLEDGFCLYGPYEKSEADGVVELLQKMATHANTVSLVMPFVAEFAYCQDDVPHDC